MEKSKFTDMTKRIMRMQRQIATNNLKKNYNDLDRLRQEAGVSFILTVGVPCLYYVCVGNKTKRIVARFQVLTAVLLKTQISTTNTKFSRKVILDERCSPFLVH
jgi:hypothetical protein